MKHNVRKSRSDAVEELLQKVETGTKAIYESERYQEMLTCMAKFHPYSVNNTILIAMQRPEATLVCGYKGWEQKFHRHVKKGEKGIQILGYTPKTITVEQEKRDELGFIVYRSDGKPEIEQVKQILPAYDREEKPGYRGRSMSVSDVVVLQQDGMETAHFCDRFGFVEVPQFLHPLEAERPMRLSERLAAVKAAATAMQPVQTQQYPESLEP